MQRVFIQDWLNSFWTTCSLHIRRTEFQLNHWIPAACSVLPFIFHDQQSECTWRRIFLLSRTPYKCKQAAGIVVVACFYPFFLYCTLLLFVYFFVPLFFDTDDVAIFHVNKSIIFVYYFKNTHFHFRNNIK